MKLFGKLFGALFGLLLITGGAFYLLMPSIMNRIVADRLANMADGEFESSLVTKAVRTDAGDKVHLKITVLAPPGSDKPGQKIFVYGLIGEDDARRDYHGDCTDAAKCKYGFPMLAGPFVPGTRYTLEVDLPKSFVDRPDAHFHLGAGSEESFYPSDDLLAPPPKD